MRSATWLLLLLSPLLTAGAQPQPPNNDPYARMIDRADAVVLGRVMEAGARTDRFERALAQIAVERWIVGPDTTQTLEVTLSPYDTFLDDLRASESQSDQRVILYLVRYQGKWWLVREPIAVPDHPSNGIELLSASQAIDRIPAIRREADASSLDSLAAQADLAVVGSLVRFLHDPSRMICRLERVLSGATTDSTLTVSSQTLMDLHRGRALLLLAADSLGTWKVLHDGAGCYYLDHDRVARFVAPAETVFARVTAAHARGVGKTGR